LECFEIPIDPRSYLEVQDPKRRYGKNLRLYFKSFQEQNGGGEGGKSRGLAGDFFQWLDGDTKPEVDGCSRQLLDSETVYYCSTLQEAERYRVQVDPESRLLVWSASGKPLTTAPSAASSSTSASTSVGVDTKAPVSTHVTTHVTSTEEAPPIIHTTPVHTIDTIPETTEAPVSSAVVTGEETCQQLKLNNNVKEPMTIHERKVEAAATSQRPASTTPLTQQTRPNRPALSTQSQSLPSSLPQPETGLDGGDTDTLLAQTQRDLPLTSTFEKLNKNKRKPSFSSLAVDPAMAMPVLARTNTSTPTALTLPTTSPFSVSGSLEVGEEVRRKGEGGVLVGSQGTETSTGTGGFPSRRGSLKSLSSFGSCGGGEGSGGCGQLQLRVSCNSTDNDNDDEEEADTEDTDSSSDSDSDSEGEGEDYGDEEVSAAYRDSSTGSIGLSLKSVPSVSTTTSSLGGSSRASSCNGCALSCVSRETSVSLLQEGSEQKKDSDTTGGHGGHGTAVPPLLPTPSCLPAPHPPAQSQAQLQLPTTSAAAALPPLERWIFVVKHDTFYAHPKITKTFPRFHHSSFLGGASVDAAGMFSVREGRIEELHLHSGHYRPTEIHLYRLLLLLLHMTSAEALAEVQVDSQRVMHIARMVNAEGSKMKKTLTTDLWPAMHMLDFLTCKKHMWGAGVFRQVHQRRDFELDGGSSSGRGVDSCPEFGRFSPGGLEGGTGQRAAGDRVSSSPLRGSAVGRIRAASEPPVSPLTFGAYFGDYQMDYQTTAWEEADLV